MRNHLGSSEWHEYREGSTRHLQHQIPHLFINNPTFCTAYLLLSFLHQMHYLLVLSMQLASERHIVIFQPPQSKISYANPAISCLTGNLSPLFSLAKFLLLVQPLEYFSSLLMEKQSQFNS
jgi:hypothetical protein